MSYINACNSLRLWASGKPYRIKAFKPTMAEFNEMLDAFASMRCSRDPNPLGSELYWLMPKNKRPTYRLFNIDVTPPDFP